MFLSKKNKMDIGEVRSLLYWNQEKNWPRDWNFLSFQRISTLKKAWMKFQDLWKDFAVQRMWGYPITNWLSYIETEVDGNNLFLYC